VTGGFVDAETAASLRDFLHSYDSESLFTETPFVEAAGGSGLRSNYLLNSTIAGLEDADLVLVVGANTRYEAPLLNARLRKCHIHNELDIGVIGSEVNLTYDYAHLGNSPSVLEDLANGKGEWAKRLKAAENPVIIVGSTPFQRDDADGVFAAAMKLGQQVGASVSVLHQAAGQVAALDIGYQAGVPASADGAEFVYLMGADAVPSSVTDGAFVVYQGHHGDAGAAAADVILPGASYTEKDATYVNTEGRSQSTRRAVTPPGIAREDWKIVRALSEFAGRTLPYDSLPEVRQRLSQLSPTLTRYDAVEKANFTAVAASIASQTKTKIDGKKPMNATQETLKDYYMTDVITKASPTMAKCVKAAKSTVVADMDVPRSGSHAAF